MNESTKILYRVGVNFSQSLIWLCALCVTFGAIYFALPPLIELFGGEFVFPFIAEVSAIVFAMGIFLPVLLLVIKLKIQIRENGIYFRIVPFHLSYRRILWADLANYEVYKRIQKETNKLGIMNTIKGKSYGLGGNQGIELDLVNGSKIFIESRRPEKIIEMIKSLLDKKG